MKKSFLGGLQIKLKTCFFFKFQYSPYNTYKFGPTTYLIAKCYSFNVNHSYKEYLVLLLSVLKNNKILKVTMCRYQDFIFVLEIYELRNKVSGRRFVDISV